MTWMIGQMKLRRMMNLNPQRDPLIDFVLSILMMVAIALGLHSAGYLFP